ncbi:hypothetical protein KSP39_PZI009444 [Platanthera zijinensis]|uniref:RING-type domain-containing protein n=1 Tax=Platanthera zijinensis TaxID=2320716 RepID=A0AAP0BL00_9ASPA
MAPPPPLPPAHPRPQSPSQGPHPHLHLHRHCLRHRRRRRRSWRQRALLTGIQAPAITDPGSLGSPPGPRNDHYHRAESPRGGDLGAFHHHSARLRQSRLLPPRNFPRRRRSRCSRSRSRLQIPLNVRASSLIQMWREMEAESGVCPTPRGLPPPAVAEETSGESDACDEAENCIDWENAAFSSSSAESETTERRRVGEIVRMLSMKISSSAASSGDEAESISTVPTCKEVNAPSAVRLISLIPAPSPTPPPAITVGAKVIRVRGRREMEDLVLRMEQDRRRELSELAERRPVSRFPFRGRIQSLTRLRSLRREVATIKHQQRSQKLEAESYQTASNDMFLRSQHDISEVLTEETMSDIQIQPSESHISSLAIPTDHSDHHCSESVSTKSLESPPQSFYSPRALFTPLYGHEDTQESSSPDASWDERSLWGGIADWQRSSESPAPETLHDEDAAEATEKSSSWRGWGVIRRTIYSDQLNKNSENREIRELLDMKTVSISLASDFSTKMNQMIASFLHRRGRQQYVDDNGGEECEQEGVWRESYEQSSDQEAAGTSSSRLSTEMLLHNQESWQSISLPLDSPMLQYQRSWQTSPLAQFSSPNPREGEDMHGVKNSIANIHHEISELRKLVESCVDWQKKLEHSIKQEVFSAVNQIVGRGNLLYDSNCMQVKKDACCICCEAQVDSLLYRCGHMCACYKCAQELQWSSGRCPICRSLIAEVIRAYPKS